jgi:hypothetical protein
MAWTSLSLRSPPLKPFNRLSSPTHATFQLFVPSYHAGTTVRTSRAALPSSSNSKPIFLYMYLAACFFYMLFESKCFRALFRGSLGCENGRGDQKKDNRKIWERFFPVHQRAVSQSNNF